MHDSVLSLLLWCMDVVKRKEVNDDYVDVDKNEQKVEDENDYDDDDDDDYDNDDDDYDEDVLQRTAPVRCGCLLTPSPHPSPGCDLPSAR